MENETFVAISIVSGSKHFALLCKTLLGQIAAKKPKPIGMDSGVCLIEVSSELMNNDCSNSQKHRFVLIFLTRYLFLIKYINLY